MKAAVWHGRGDVRLETVPEPPEPVGEDVLLEVRWTGICGTDLHEFLGGPIFIPPAVDRVILGHELAAEVVAAGPEVASFRPGDRVTVVPHRVCRTCHFCRRGMFQHCRNLELVGLTRDGAFARFTVAREDQLVRLPDEVPDEVGALVEPLAVTLRAMQLPGVRPGQDVVVIGAGPIGLCAVLTARATGMRRVYVVEKMPGRAALAQAIGATAVIDPGEEDAVAVVSELTAGRGADVAIECVGLVETVNLAISLARPGGLAIVIGISEHGGDVNLHHALRDEKEIRGCIGYFEGEFDCVIDLLADGRLDPTPLISQRIGVDDIVERGFQRLRDDKDSCVKVLVHP